MGNRASVAQRFGKELSSRPLAGAPERADAEVEKDRDHNGGSDKGAMIRPGGPVHASVPKHWSKDDYGQEKKHARDFKPDYSADAAEGAQKAADTLDDAPACTAGGLGCCPYEGAGICLRSGCLDGLCACRRARRPLKRPHESTARKASANPEDTAYSLRSHSVYDGISDPWRFVY